MAGALNVKRLGNSRFPAAFRVVRETTEVFLEPKKRWPRSFRCARAQERKTSFEDDAGRDYTRQE